jgi:hypothetical protein
MERILFLEINETIPVKPESSNASLVDFGYKLIFQIIMFKTFILKKSKKLIGKLQEKSSLRGHRETSVLFRTQNYL